MMQRIWQFLSGVKTTLWLVVAAIVLILTGSFYVKTYKMGFNSLNHVLFQDWFREWGSGNPDKIWWLLSLIVVLFLLGVNTACCVLDRLFFHWRKRQLTGTRIFLVKIAPTLIHACFGVMLAGHLASITVGYRSRNMEFLCRPGETANYALPEGAGMEVGPPVCEFYTGPFAGSIRKCRAELLLTANGERIVKPIAIAEPVHWNGFQIHLSQAPARNPLEPFSTPSFQLIIKRDPGLRLIMICFPILILLTLFYYVAEKTGV